MPADFSTENPKVFADCVGKPHVESIRNQGVSDGYFAEPGNLAKSADILTIQIMAGVYGESKLLCRRGRLRKLPPDRLHVPCLKSRGIRLRIQFDTIRADAGCEPDLL